MAKKIIKLWVKKLISRLAQFIVSRGLRPEVTPLLTAFHDATAHSGTERSAAEWILRHGLAQGVADLLTAADPQRTALSKPLSPASVQWAQWLARDCLTNDTDGSIHMPLVKRIDSTSVNATFFDGENTQVMEGTIISPDTRIGGNTYIGFNCHVTKAQIGRYVSIADGVLIGPGEHFLNQISTSSLFYKEPYDMLTRDSCVIHDDVWVGASSIIRRGVSIGTGAVIGANSFVNHDVEPYSIMVGSPARCVGVRFSKPQIDAILKSRWWELPLPQAQSRIAELTLELGLSS